MSENLGVDDQTEAAPRDEAAVRLRTFRTFLHATIGQVVLVMSAVPRYRNQALATIPESGTL